MKLSPSLNDQLMALAAHRYCLGRASCIVSACHEWLRATWEDFDANTRRVMVRDTAEALMDGRAGHSMDARGWREFLAWAWERMATDERDWVRQAVAHRSEPWPLTE